MKQWLLLLTLSAFSLACAPRIERINSNNRLSNLRNSTVEYSDNGTKFEGYLVYDASRTNVVSPTIILVHEWMGINDFIKAKADSLAALGFVAFAADVYGKGIRPTTREEAGKQASMYRDDRELYRSRMNTALSFVQTITQVDRERIGVIGYCFGGTGALELARSGADVKGVVSIHGGLSSPRPIDAHNIKGKVLVLHGADDPSVPPAEVQKFMEEMESADVDYQFHSYAGAVHAFTNPASGNDKSRGAAYDSVAAERAWDQMLLFFANDLTLDFPER